MLNNNTIVTTIMSNSALKGALLEAGIKCEQTNVGDRFVYERMQEKDYCLGGENSGHIIMKKYATTGDGMLTALMLAEEMCDTKLSLGELASPVKFYPQYLKNVRVKNKNAVMADSEVLKSLEETENLIKGKGRVLLRQSGTEEIIRIMVESETQEKCIEYAQKIADVIKGRGFCID